jgi:hypothetical protein
MLLRYNCIYLFISVIAEFYRKNKQTLLIKKKNFLISHLNQKKEIVRLFSNYVSLFSFQS